MKPPPAPSQGTASPKVPAARVRWQDLLWQALLLAALVGLGWWMVSTASDNLAKISAKSGFGFLLHRAAFELGESLIAFTAGDTYLRAFAVGLLNTLKVSLLGIALATVLGVLVALGRLSSSAVLSRLCKLYVEVVRNVPLLLQLIFWHTAITQSLPPVRRALSLGLDVYLSNRGLVVPVPVPGVGQWAALAALLAGLVLAVMAARRDRRHGVGFTRTLARGAALVLGLPALVLASLGSGLHWDVPVLAGFNFQGGATVSPEFAAVLLGLSIYNSSFIAEIVRAGIVGVDRGQREAALSVGLTPGQTLRLVIMPQALRIILPPLSNSYLNLTKESSLAVAVGYPELMRVAIITLAETNQAIECIVLIVLVYLVLSLITAALTNAYNRRLAATAW